MAGYYVDISGPGCDHRDDTGRECAGLKDALQRAVGVALAAARAHGSLTAPNLYTVKICDLSGVIFYRATLTATRQG